MKYQKLVQNAIDLHVHIGPEIIPRRFTLAALLAYERGKLKGIGVKNHFFPTANMDSEDATGSPFAIRSVVLNRYVGGLNPDAVRAVADLSARPIIVWFPTIHAGSFLNEAEFEVPSEWLPKGSVNKTRRASDIKGISVFDERGDVSLEACGVLEEIKRSRAILATGHLSWEGSRALVK